jgi:hypothetical protein
MSPAERQAPQLRVQRWIGVDGGNLATPIQLSDLGVGPKIVFAFQHWCRGCHLHGFPTLQKLHGALESRGVGFAVIQTVFEGAHENTFEKLRIVNRRRTGTPYRRAIGTPFAGWGAVVPVVHRRDPRPAPRAPLKRWRCRPWEVPVDPPGQPPGGGSGGRVLAPVSEPPAVVASLDDVAVMGERSSSAAVILGSPKTVGHSPNARFVVMITEVRS